MNRPSDLPASNHYATNKQAILSQEYRFLYPRSAISEAFLGPAVQAAGKAMKQKNLYDPVATMTGVPWWVVACLHHMECDANPAGGIDNGDPWNKATVHVPAHRGPYASFEAEAVDALLQYQKPENWGVHLTGRNWNDPGWVFWFLESWNGFGARQDRGGQTTPPHAPAYLYNGAEMNHVPLYLKGKDTSDFHFDPEARSSQVGCFAFMLALEQAFGKVLATY